MRPPGAKCICSRCKLYIRADSHVQDPKSQDSSGDCECGGPKRFEEREYQSALVEIAKARNVITCLPTGSGKTYIALMLIKSLEKEILDENKKVIFLANTVPLVGQQAGFFARNSNFAVRHLTGDMEVDYWSEEKWKLIVDGYQVLAMTTQIFLNILRHAYIKFSQIALIIFDECHHAVNKHPMKEVMVKYHECKKTEPNYPFPRILGLTATVIIGNCEPNEVSLKIMDLEITMNSKAITYKHYETVLRHSTSSNIYKNPVVVGNDPLEWTNLYLLDELNQYSKELNIFRNKRKKEKALAALAAKEFDPSRIDPTLRNTANIYSPTNRKPTPGDLKIAVDDIIASCQNLGPYCAVISINLRLAFIEFSLLDLTDGEIKLWYTRIRDLFLRIGNGLEDFMNGYSKAYQVENFVTPKMKKLISILNEKYVFDTNNVPVLGIQQQSDEEEDGTLCGLIFTDRRVTAQVLSWYLQDLAEFSPNYHFVKAGFVVGTSRTPFESVDSRVYAKKQTEILMAFRQKRLNLLVATSVLEEGLDVPSCNLVIRFDRIRDFTSYVQSMGRARMKNAQFHTLIPVDNYYKESCELDKYRNVHQSLASYLISNVEKVDETVQSYQPEHHIEPFCPGGTPDSPTVSMESAQDVVNWYCNTLSSDEISFLQTLSWWTQVGTKFKAYLKLPINSVVRETIEGPLMDTKELAKDAVYLEAAKKLYFAKGLDDNLLPIRPTFPPKIDNFFKKVAGHSVPDENEEEMRTEPPAPVISNPVKFELQKDWYEKTGSEFLHVTTLVPGQPFYLYRIELELEEPKAKYAWDNSLYKFQNHGTAYGIICSKEIPQVGEFPLYGGFGRVGAKLSLVHHFQRNLSSQELNKYRRFHGIIFSNLLGISNNDLVEIDQKLPFAIVLLEKGSDNSWIISNNLMSEVEKLSSDKPPHEAMKPPLKDVRLNAARRRDTNRFGTRSTSYNKYENAVIVPWYKGQKQKPIYCVDKIEYEMNPMSPFHDGNYSNYKDFIKTNYRKDIYDLGQPMLKCKLMILGKAPQSSYKQQLNFLLERPTKEDQYPVYLVPELCFILPIPSSVLVQAKFIPSFLHRLDRLFIGFQLLKEIGWTGEINSNENSALIQRFSIEQAEQRDVEERRRENLRKKTLAHGKRAHSPEKTVTEIIHIERRELHYEFIHPNKITKDDIEFFHEAVSNEYAAKRLICGAGAGQESTEVETNELCFHSKIRLLPMDQLAISSLEPQIDPTVSPVPTSPSLLSLIEALTLRKSNDGLSNTRLRNLGEGFLTYAISGYVYSTFGHFPESLLVQLRNRDLSMQFLVSIAKKKKVPELLAGSDFHPGGGGGSWLPPGFTLKPEWKRICDLCADYKTGLGIFEGQNLQELMEMSEEKLKKLLDTKIQEKSNPGIEPTKKKPKDAAHRFIPFSTFTHTEIPDSEILDGIYGLIGCFYSKSGSSGTFKFLEWLEFPLLNSEMESILFTGLSDPELTAHQPILPNPNELKTLLPKLKKIESTLAYEFKNPCFLLEALTHPTYFGNNFTNCYQKLEFLGDGILDFLLTNYVYSSLSDKSVSDLKDIRSALVNNITYASLCVRYELYKNLLYSSKLLMDMIDNFVVYQEGAEHEVTGHFTLISDEECVGLKHVEVPKVLGDIFEAIAGAVYMDSGRSLDTVWRVFYRLMQHDIDLFCVNTGKAPGRELKELLSNEIDYKNWTSKKLRARGKEMVKISLGPYGDYYGTGTSRIRAREAAAKLALKMMKDEKDFNTRRGDTNQIMLIV